MATSCKAVAFINHGSGGNDKATMPDRVREIFKRNGIPCHIEMISRDKNIETMAREAAESGAEVIMAGGGDGTLRAVAQVLAGTQTAMAVLPVGTLNHFARDLEIPLDVEQATEIAATGTAVHVDIGEASGRVFINNAVMGLYPAYRSEKDWRQSRGWGSRAAALAGVLATFWRYPVLKVRFEVNGAETVRRTPYVLIGNNQHAMEGTRPWERSSMTEGHLFVYVLRDQSRLAFARILLKLVLGRFRGAEEFEMICTSAVSIRTRRKNVRVSLDGEIVKLRSPVVFRSRAQALKVIVAAGSRRAHELSGGLKEGVPSAS